MTENQNDAADQPVAPEPNPAESAPAQTPAASETSAAAPAADAPTPAAEPAAPAAPEAPAAPMAPAAPAAPAAAAPAEPAAPNPVPAAASVAAGTTVPAPAAQAPTAAPAAPPAPPAPAAPNATVYTPGQAPQPYHAQYATQPTTPVAAATPTAPAAGQTQPTVPLAGSGQVPPAFGGPRPAPSTPAEPRKRRTGGSIVAVAVAAALIGGASGAGITALIASNQRQEVVQSAAESQNIVVNDTDSVNQITAVAAKASPSVVTISVSSSAAGGTGSGVILSEDGYVLTNTHVVTLDGATADPTIEVKTSDGHLYAAELIGTDPLSDLAVVKLADASGLKPLEFADSDELNVGATAIAIGAPMGLSGTVTNGIVSALNRSIEVASSAAPETPDDGQSDGGQDGQQPFDFWNFPGEEDQAPTQQGSGTISIPVIQTDAAINPGNSGGALVDDEGKLIGVNVAILSTGGSSSSSGNIGVGFAVPANLAHRIATELIENGSASHGLLGAAVTSADAAEGATQVGALITEVTPGGAAESAGLQAGDVVTEFNGVPITSPTDLTAQVRALPGGTEADVTYVRDGNTETATVTLGTFEG
ncbi:S1C family serine protease [Agromyces sp. MMS24-K17]|uniref:S1C family serine protease n=1 Tax=Agromyces sp. MMS24-K17 TaxID=3372850 RepID=UPI00375526F2